MKCCSRSTLGVIIGGINVLFYVGCSAVVIGLLIDSKTPIKADRSSTFVQTVETFGVGEERTIVGKDEAAAGAFLLSTMLSVFLVMSLISALLIVGIVKRRHQLMWPWLALSGIAFLCGCFRIIFSVVVGLVNGVAAQDVLIQFMAGILGVGLQALILWPIFTLCRDIMQKNNQKPGQVLQGVQYSYVAPEAPPQYFYNNSDLPKKS